MKADSNDTEIIHHDDYYKGPALVSLPCGSITLLDLAINRYRNNPNLNVYGTIRNGEVVWTTNQQFLLQVIQIFLFIKNYLKRGMVAGICSENRYEWVASHQSIHMAGCMDCAIYPTATKDAILHILNQTEMEVCFLSGERASFLAKYILPEEKDTKLKHVIVFDDFDEKEVYKKMGIQVHLWSDLNQSKNSSKEFIDQVLKEHEETMMTGKKDRYTPCTICYTSGTTGLPKGVVLSNINFIEILGGFLRTEDEFFVKINQDDVYLSYLTLSHVLERVAQMVVSFNGGSVVFYSGDMYKLGSDLSLVRPTLLAAVPAVLSKMRDKIMEKIRAKRQFTQTLFAKCLSRKIKAQKYGEYSSFIYDFLVFKKIAKSLGGRLRAVLVGGALTDPKLIEFFQAVLSCKVFVGYGSTEMTGLGCLTPVECYDTNIVGTPFPTVQFKAVNEHGDPEKKEIYVRGRTVFSEYYKNEEETKKSIIEGWYKTGDLGFFQSGKLKIVGRNKDHFKNSKGEFVSPERIEIALRQSPIDDILVVGNSNVGYVAAIVVCSEEFTETEILDEINQICKEQLEQQTMKPFEVPKKVLLRREPFDKLGDIRTATNKLKRHEIERILKDEIDQLLKAE